MQLKQNIDDILSNIKSQLSPDKENCVELLSTEIQKLISENYDLKEQNEKLKHTIKDSAEINHIKNIVAQKANENYSMLFELSADSIVIHDTKNIIYANHVALDLIGAERFDDISKKSVKEFIHKDYYESYKKRLLSILKNDEISPVSEEKLIRLDGSIIDVETRGTSIYENGQRFVIAVIRNITDRKKSEKSLRESQSRLWSLINTIPYPIYLKDTDLKYTECNKAFAEFVGLSKSKIIGHTVFSVWRESQADKFHRSDLQMTDHNELQMYETTVIAHDNAKRNVFITKSCISDATGKITGIVGMVNDITESKRIQENINYREQLFSQIYDNSPVLMHSFDKLGHITNVNREWLERTGYKYDEVMGKHFTFIMTKESANRANETVIPKLWSEEAVEDVPFQYMRKDGEIMDTLMSCVAVSDPQGRRLSISVVQDVTDKLRKERQIKEQNEQLKDLNATRDKFFSIIAHDLKNPFNTLFGFTEILLEYRDELNAEDRTRIIQTMHSSVKKAFALLQNLLQWSRSQTGRISFKPKSFGLKRLVDEAIEPYITNAESKLISIVNAVSETDRVEVDENMMKTVLRNLISNAIKFTAENGEVRILAEDYNGKVKVSVKDSGVGMKKEDIDKLFKIDVNHTTIGTAKEKGTGLGLILCQEFVNNHDGEIFIDSVVGEGSVFSFTIPVVSNE